MAHLLHNQPAATMELNRRRDLLAAIGFITIAVAILFIAIPYGVQEPKKVKFLALSPSYYPRLVCYCLLGFGLALLARQIFSSLKAGESENNSDLTIKPVYLLTIAATLTIFYIALPYLGFVLSTSVLLLVLLLLAGDRNIVSLVAIPLLLPISVYLFFTKVANIPIPGGILEPLLTGI